MRTRRLLTALCLIFALSTQAFCGDGAASCRRGAFRGWLKAVFSNQCKGCKKEAEPEAKDDAKDAAKDAPKPDPAPAPPAPVPAK